MSQTDISKTHARNRVSTSMYNMGIRKISSSLEPEERLEVALKLLNEDDGARSVYFILAEEVAKVKIGIANNPYTRLSELQSNSPVHLKLIRFKKRCTVSTERAIHVLYEHLREHGEWFKFDEELQLLVESLDI